MHTITKLKDHIASSLEACKRFFHIITIPISHFIASNSRGQYNSYTSGGKYTRVTTGRQRRAGSKDGRV